MKPEELMFLVLGGMGFLLLLVLGLAMVCTDLGTGMFCVYKDGDIWTARGLRLMKDTPQNRRRVSRGFGLFFIAVDCLAAAGLAAAHFF